jgi:hypothetical protein
MVSEEMKLPGSEVIDWLAAFNDMQQASKALEKQDRNRIKLADQWNFVSNRFSVFAAKFCNVHTRT